MIKPVFMYAILKDKTGKAFDNPIVGFKVTLAAHFDYKHKDVAWENDEQIGQVVLVPDIDIVAEEFLFMKDAENDGGKAEKMALAKVAELYSQQLLKMGMEHVS